MQTSNQKWFSRVIWFGVLANWSFAVWVLFFDANQLLNLLGLDAVESTLWLYNYSVLLIILSCFYIPAAGDCVRYRANAWLLIVGRLIPAFTFFVGVFIGFMPKGFLLLGLGDGSIGLLEWWLLVRIVRDERHG